MPPVLAVTVDEDALLSGSIARIERPNIALVNRAGTKVDAERLRQALMNVPGIETVTAMTLEGSSGCNSLEFLRSLPQLESLIIRGSGLPNLSGLEHFSGAVLMVGKAIGGADIFGRARLKNLRAWRKLN